MLVFAAIVAIVLYRVMPIAAFEAKLQKEEYLVSVIKREKRVCQACEGGQRCGGAAADAIIDKSLVSA